MTSDRVSPLDRGGVALGVGAYTLWGLFPAFWPLLDPAAPLEVLAHRIVWTALLMTVALTVLRGWAALRGLGRRGWSAVAAAAVFIAVNWGMFIYGVSIDLVVEAALGYYMSPLVSVALGVLVLRERLGVAQWVALGLGAAAVLVISIGNGTVPWLSMVLAGSFGMYGLIKATVPLPASASLTAEGDRAVPAGPDLHPGGPGERERHVRRPRTVAPAADALGRAGDRAAAAALRHVRAPDPAVHARRADVPEPDPAVPVGRARGRRADAARALGRVRADLGGPGGVHGGPGPPGPPRRRPAGALDGAVERSGCVDTVAAPHSRMAEMAQPAIGAATGRRVSCRSRPDRPSPQHADPGPGLLPLDIWGERRCWRRLSTSLVPARRLEALRRARSGHRGVP